MKIGFITSDPETFKKFFPTRAEPDLVPSEPMFTPDDQIAVNELRKSGFQVEPVIWGSPVASLQQFNLVIVRSPWDYMDNEKNKNAFIHWINALEKSGVKVANPVKLMEWLLDKHYLQHLNKEGVAVIPTIYYEAGSHLNLREYFEKNGQFIAKPCVSAAGVGLFHIQSVEDALQHQAEIDNRLKTGAYMVQEFKEEIIANGEWSFVFLGGKCSHSIHKKPGENSILVHAERGGTLSFTHKPKDSIIQFANETSKKIIPAFKKTTGLAVNEALILYLRLDIIETNVGPLLIECEGVEPELFFRAKPESEIVFRQAIAAIA